MGTLVNRAELADALDISLPTLDRYRGLGLPAEKEGAKGSQWLFDLDKVRVWLSERDARIAAEIADKKADLEKLQAEFDLEKHEDDAGKLAFRLQRDYFDLDEKREKRNLSRKFLCRTAEVTQKLNELFIDLSDWLQTLPDKLEQRCHLDPETVEMALEMINERQAQLAREIDEWQLDDRRDDAA